MFMSEINMKGREYYLFKRTQFVLCMSVCTSHASPLCFLYIASYVEEILDCFFVLLY